ncbi:hypothetical protein [Streptomyces roseolus]|uniref:hypothetical protein n=1 Tax=Streptomyces roseolus TaxID=67358 RepID=UPI0036512614
MVLEDGRTGLVNRGWVPGAANQRDYPEVPGRLSFPGPCRSGASTPPRSPA